MNAIFQNFILSLLYNNSFCVFVVVVKLHCKNPHKSSQEKVKKGLVGK